MSKRQGNRLDRRVAPAGSIPPEALAAVAQRLRYDGSAIHKFHPGDYGFIPPSNPRATKSACDALRPILRAEAKALFKTGLALGMVSAFDAPSTPKYVWVVDRDDEVYEAKTKPPDVAYHGYRIGEDETDMRRYILVEWRKRCPRG
jgi:hypothetical protein